MCEASYILKAGPLQVVANTTLAFVDTRLFLQFLHSLTKKPSTILQCVTPSFCGGLHLCISSYITHHELPWASTAEWSHEGSLFQTTTKHWGGGPARCGVIGTTQFNIYCAQESRHTEEEDRYTVSIYDD